MGLATVDGRTLQVRLFVCFFFILFAIVFTFRSGNRDSQHRRSKWLLSEAYYHRSSPLQLVNSFFSHPPEERVDRAHRRLPSKPQQDICWIITCADRDLNNTQRFKGEGFRDVPLGMPDYIQELGIHPSWCRVGHLLDALNVGQRCVVYADDDVYLDLRSLKRQIDTRKPGSVLVVAGDRHGMDMHINTGLVVFTDLQSPYARFVVEMWYAAKQQPRNIPYSVLRDQAALNRIMTCEDPEVVCYPRTTDGVDEGLKLGLLRHCFSAKDKKLDGSKATCMRLMKQRIAPWDADTVATASDVKDTERESR